MLLKKLAEFKEKGNKETADEIESLCLKISAEWPEATLPKDEKRKEIQKIFISENFLKLRKLIEEFFPQCTDLDILTFSLVIAGRTIIREKQNRR